MATRGRPRAFDPDEALRKALAVFWERGYEGTSMNDLVEAMGIASASIYAAFGSKAELFRRTMGLYGATRGEPPRRALPSRPATAPAGPSWRRSSPARWPPGTRSRPGLPCHDAAAGLVLLRA
jgi:AcrR family transcriptional regulator